LKACFSAFREVSAAKYDGIPFDLPAIERKVAHLREKRMLGYDDLRYFEAPEHWWFTKFWVFPPERDLARSLKGKTFDFWHLPKRESTVIGQLLEVFKSIELASIILRFIRPDAYGIISPPVERILDVRRGSDAIETYQNYLSDLRSISSAYGFDRVANADMALWVLHEKCFGELRDEDVAASYRADPEILRIRAKNLVLPLSDISHPRLAEALVHTKPDLAAVVACHSLELLLREIAVHIAPDIARLKMESLIEELPNYSGIDVIRKGIWKRLLGVRNRLFHEGRLPSAREAADLVTEVVRVEQDAHRLRKPGVGLRRRGVDP